MECHISNGVPYIKWSAIYQMECHISNGVLYIKWSAIYQSAGGRIREDFVASSFSTFNTSYFVR